MIRMIKTLGLLACAALAMSAVFAAGASAQHAEDGEFRSGETPENHTPTKFTAEQYGGVTANLFHAFGSSLHCTDESTSFHGETTGTDTTIKVNASYEDCFSVDDDEHSIERNVTVTMNGCEYQFNQPTMVDGTDHDTWTGTVDLVCEGNNEVEVHVYGLANNHNEHGSFDVCTEFIPPQKGIEGVEYHNVAGEPDDLTVTINAVENIEATREGLCGGAETTTASYTSNLTVASTEDHDLWIATHGA